MPSPLAEQLLVSRLLGLTVRTGVGDGETEQLHVTLAVLPGPVKLKVVLAGQFCGGTLTVTCITCPGFNVPLEGLKLTPLIPVLVAFQLSLTCEPADGDSITSQDWQPLLKLLTLAVSIGVGVTVGTQLHNTEAVFTALLKENTAEAGHVTFGTEAVTCTDRPGERVPLSGLKRMPLRPLLVAFQFTLPWALVGEERVTMQDRQPFIKLLGETLRRPPLIDDIDDETTSVTPTWKLPPLEVMSSRVE